jgi:RNA polymerase-associated protein CTR9
MAQTSALRAACDAVDLSAASATARDIIRTCSEGGSDAAALSKDGLFEALCVQATVAVLENASKREVRTYLRAFDQLGELAGYRRALRLYVEGTSMVRETPATARAKFNESLAADPHFVMARLGLGAAYFAEQNWKQCFTEYKLVLMSLGSLCPNLVRVGMGVCAFHLRQNEHAEKCLARALAVDPDEPMALLAMFAIHVHHRRTHEAATLIQRLTEIAPTTLIMQKYHDLLFFRDVAQKKIASSAGDLLGRVELTMKSATAANDKALVAYAHMQRGRILEATGEFQGALEAYNQAVILAPTLRAAVVHRAAVQHHLGDASAQAASVAQGLALHDKDPQLIAMAAALNSTVGEHTRAVALAQRLTTTVAKHRHESFSIAAWTNRLDAATYRDLATVAGRLEQRIEGREDRALAANRAVLSADRAALVTAARTNVKLDVDSEDANTFITPEQFPYVYNAALLLEHSDPARARRLYVRLVKSAPSQSASYERLVILAERTGRVAEALRWARLLQAAAPRDSTGIVLQAWVLKNHGHLLEALELVRGAVQQNKSPELASAYGSLYMSDIAGSGRAEAKINHALNGFKFALAADRRNVLAAHGAACCVAANGWHAKASVLLERVSEIDCNVPTVKTNVREHRFNVLLATHGYRNAISTFAKKAERTKHQRCALALCYSKVGNHDEAINELNTALAEHPKDATVCFYLSFALLSAAFDTVTSPLPVDHAVGTVARDRIQRALDTFQYAAAVRSTEQREAVKRIWKYVEKGAVDRALERRMADRERERRDAEATKEAWRLAASQVDLQRRDTVTALRDIEQQKQTERVAASQADLELTRDVVARMSGFLHPVDADGPTAPDVDLGDNDVAAEQNLDGFDEGSLPDPFRERPSAAASPAGLEATFDQLAANIEATLPA